VAVSFGDLLTSLRRTLRDESTNTWTDAQLGELINQGIDAINTIYPEEAIETLSYTQPVSGSVFSVTLSTVKWPLRIDVYDASNKFVETLRPTLGDGADGGWEMHANILFFPPHYTLNQTGTFRVFGYGEWAQIAATYTTASVAVTPSSVTTDLNTRAANAVKVFVQAEALTMLTFDRAQFQQWQVGSGNTDISALGMNNLAMAAQQRWRTERQRIRTFRKMG
jgi:hypothetical protein